MDLLSELSNLFAKSSSPVLSLEIAAAPVNLKICVSFPSLLSRSVPNPEVFSPVI